jgi:outer membrane protein OmpA-like peptidoglycan-associated protein
VRSGSRACPDPLTAGEGSDVKTAHSKRGHSAKGPQKQQQVDEAGPSAPAPGKQQQKQQQQQQQQQRQPSKAKGKDAGKKPALALSEVLFDLASSSEEEEEEDDAPGSEKPAGSEDSDDLEALGEQATNPGVGNWWADTGVTSIS